MKQEYEVLEVPIDEITPSPDNPRKTFDEKKLEALKGSIESRDLTEPIIIRKANKHIIKGERRWRAEKAAGRKTIQVRIYDVDEFRAKEMRLEQEADISDREKEDAFYALFQTGRYKSIPEMARIVGADTSSVKRYVAAKEDRIVQLNVPDEVTHVDLAQTRALGEVDTEARNELLAARAKKELSYDELTKVAQTAAEIETHDELLADFDRIQKKITDGVMDRCLTCGDVLEPHWVSCPTCGQPLQDAIRR
jgi:ParB family chromosome partitioning protein